MLVPRYIICYLFIADWVEETEEWDEEKEGFKFHEHYTCQWAQQVTEWVWSIHGVRLRHIPQLLLWRRVKIKGKTVSWYMSVHVSIHERCVQVFHKCIYMGLDLMIWRQMNYYLKYMFIYTFIFI